ncbi:MAG: DNA-formamidopyrimidine glycosylase family protein [Planctomycetaceae bacterium]
MPEGDTIHRLAATLRRALGEGPVEAFVAPGVPGPLPLPGERIEEIGARGKHLLLRFSGGATLHTHLGMTGSWRVLRPGSPSRPFGGRPGRAAIVTTPRATALCRDAPTLELLDDAGVRRHPQLTALGPDLCAPEVDLDEVLRRLDALVDPTTELGVVLLDQRPACGIGNVYRSEALWACGAHPLTPLAEVDADARRALYATAHALLRANLDGFPRRTVPEGLAVYDRAGRRCRRCGETIRARRLGEHARTTWWCPGCQTGAGMQAREARA